MAQTKGRKLYVAISECEIVGIWSNLTSLCNHFEHTDLAYAKVYREVRQSLSIGDEMFRNFKFDFLDMDGKAYQIKIEILR